MTTQPFFKTNLPGYFGGKAASGTPHKIINLIPKHKTFVSGFLGNCAILRYKKPAFYNIGIDLNPDIIEQWRQSHRPFGHEVQLHCLDFINTEFNWFDNESFVYLDPPYPHETRTSRNRYDFELSEVRHVELLNKILQLDCMVAISCYDTRLYKHSLSHWNRIDFNSQTRGGPRRETLYYNYPTPQPHELHDTRFIGADFRAREKSTRRIKTILGKIERLTPEERARIKEFLSAEASQL